MNTTVLLVKFTSLMPRAPNGKYIFLSQIHCNNVYNAHKGMNLIYAMVFSWMVIAK